MLGQSVRDILKDATAIDHMKFVERVAITGVAHVEAVESTRQLAFGLDITHLVEIHEPS